MTETLPRLDEAGDAELISAVRGGDVSAYGGLFERHVGAARRLARQLVGPADADDLVSDAYMKVLRVLQNGGGPDIAFRAYLLTAIRRLHVDRMRAGAKLHSTDDMEAFDPGVPFRDTAVEGFESQAAAEAFASLPERWQLVLWHTEVEGQKPAEVAALLGISANSVSALAYRAREGLRQAFLNSHAADIDDAECAWTHEHLGAYIRNGVSKRDASKVEKHLDECRKCMAIYLELTEVNSNLGGILAPLLLGGAGIGYLAGAGGVAAKGGLVALLDRARDTVTSNGQAAAIAGVAAVAAVIGISAAMLSGGDDGGPAANPPASEAPGTPGSGDEAAPPAPTSPAAPPATPAPAETAAPPAVGTGGPQGDEPGAGATGSGGQDVGSTGDQTGTGDQVGTGDQAGDGSGAPGGGSANTAPSRKDGAPTSVTVRAGQTATFVVDDYAIDAEGDPLSFVDATATNGDIAGAALARGRALGAMSADGSRFLVYTPRDGFSGNAVVEFDVTDGRAETHFRVRVVVSPAAVNDVHLAAADTRTGFTVPPLLGNDSGSGLRFVGAGGVQAGNRVIVVNGQVRYEYADSFVGPDSFTYVVADRLGRRANAQATVTITNQAPVVTPQGSTPIEVQLGGGAVEVATYRDANHDQASISTADTEHGTLTVVDDTIQYTVRPGARPGVIDRFTYSVVDDRGGVSASNTALVVVVATPVPDPDPTNTPPTANDDTATTSRGVPVTIDVLANDSDPDADDLAVSGTTTPGHGTVRVSAGAVTYTPDDGFTGQDTFTYAISDGRGGTDLATVSVTVTPPPNRPPDAVDDEATTGRDLPVTVDVLGNDTDADQDELTVTGAGTPGNGTAVVNADGTITYTPDDGFTGQDTLTYTVSDGRGGTATATVRVIVQQDLTVQVLAVDRVDLGEGDVWFVTVAVDGLESGGATLRATSDPPGARVIGNDCQALLTTGCRVTPGRHEFEIQLQAPVGTTLTFEVDPDDQTEDFDAGNNMGSETLVEPVE